MLTTSPSVLMQLFLFGLAAASATAEVNRGRTEPGKLTLKSIQFYSSGLARFTYVTQLRTESVLSFSVPSLSVSDVLRTISVQDPENGIETITVRPYENSKGPDPAAVTASRIDCLLSQTGEEMELTLKSGKKLAGKLITVESSLEAFGDQIAQRARVSLLSHNAVESALLDDVVTFRYLNPKSQKQLEQAVDGLRASGPKANSNLARIEVHCAEADPRRVTISFMQSMPVWKCSYVLNDGSLQMHIVIDNPTSQDWKDVEILVADGRPIAFEVDMHQRVMLQREHVQLPLGIPGLPPIFDERLNLENLPNPEFGADTFNEAAMGGMGGGFGYEGSSEHFGDEFTQYPSNLSLVTSSPRGTAIPSGHELALIFKRQAANEGVFRGSPLTLKFPPTSIPARSSGLLASPLLDCNVTHCSVFVPGYDDGSTLMAIELVNESDTLLPPGPLTLQTNGRYQGEAMLDRTSCDSTRLIGFALDTTVQVEEQPERDAETVEELHFDNNSKVLNVVRTIQRTRTFTIQNTAANERSVVINLPKDGDWELRESSGSSVEQNSMRISAIAPARQRFEKEVVLYRKPSNSLHYATCELEQLRGLLKSDIEEQDKAAVQELLDRRTAILKAKRKMDQLQIAIEQSQSTVDRLVKILSTAGLHGDTISKYAERIELSEKELEKLILQERDTQTELEEHTKHVTLEPAADFWGSSRPIENYGTDPFNGDDPFGN